MTGSDASLACSSPGSPPPKCPALPRRGARPGRGVDRAPPRGHPPAVQGLDRGPAGAAGRRPGGIGRARPSPCRSACCSAVDPRAYRADHPRPGAVTMTPTTATGRPPVTRCHRTSVELRPKAVWGRDSATGRQISALAGALSPAARLRGRGAPAQLPRRVRVPLQPPALPQSRAAVLPRAWTRRGPRPGPLDRDLVVNPRPKKRPASTLGAGVSHRVWSVPQRTGRGEWPDLACSG
jgi:hypothetical protein